MDLISDWICNNKKYEENGCDGSSFGDITLTLDRKSNLLLTSLHGVNHYRGDGSKKFADLFTGGLTETLGQTLNLSICTNLRREPEISPFLGPCLIERKITANFKNVLILDIHGASDSAGFDIALGTFLETPLPIQSLLIDQFHRYNNQKLKVAINQPGYAGQSSKTLTRRLIEAGHDRIVQLEISRKFRSPDTNPERALMMINYLQNVLVELNSYEF